MNLVKSTCKCCSIIQIDYDTMSFLCKKLKNRLKFFYIDSTINLWICWQILRKWLISWFYTLNDCVWIIFITILTKTFNIQNFKSLINRIMSSLRNKINSLFEFLKSRSLRSILEIICLFIQNQILSIYIFTSTP
jgi:hypothetical protein